MYESICSFSNRNGGHIFLGVKDSGTILGIQTDCIERMKNDFFTSANSEGDIFRIIVPLPEVATATVGPAGQVSTEVNTEVSTEVSTEVRIKLPTEKLHDLLEYCSIPRTRAELQLFCGIKTEKYFREKVLRPMITAGIIKRTIPDKPRSSKQKYIRA